MVTFSLLSEKALYSLAITPSLFSFPYGQTTTNLLFVSIDVPVLDISYKWDHITCSLLCLASFLLIAEWYSVLWLEPILSFFFHDGHLGCFHLLALVNSNTVLVWTPVFIWGYIPRSGNWWVMCNSVLNFWETTKLFSTVIAPFDILTSSVWGFQFFHLLANTFSFSSPPLFKKNCTPSKGCEVVSHWFWFALPY